MFMLLAVSNVFKCSWNALLRKSQLSIVVIYSASLVPKYNLSFFSRSLLALRMAIFKYYGLRRGCCRDDL